MIKLLNSDVVLSPNHRPCKLTVISQSLNLYNSNNNKATIKSNKINERSNEL